LEPQAKQKYKTVTIIIWIKIANKSFLELGMLNKYATKDKKNTITAVPITTRRFGPSGSLKNKNITLEQTMDVMPRIISEVFFDLRYIFSNYTSCRTWTYLL
jgi:hypothetical protein